MTREGHLAGDRQLSRQEAQQRQSLDCVWDSKRLPSSGTTVSEGRVGETGGVSAGLKYVGLGD